MIVSINYTIPDELDIYKAALAIKTLNRAEKSLDNKIELYLTKDEADIITSLLKEAKDLCDVYAVDSKNTNRALILDKIKENKQKYVNILNYINFMQNKL